jgi:predicted DNA-binding ArsR family transcriptional regulator
MNRIKVVNEPADLIPVLRAMDTEEKRKVFQEIAEDWYTEKDIEEKYGKKGVEALRFFEKMGLVEIQWKSGEEAPEKAYHTFYTSFYINASSPVEEISDVLAVAVMTDNEFEKVEKKILSALGGKGRFAGDVAEELELSTTMLKGLIKRSLQLDFKGHSIERIEG